MGEISGVLLDLFRDGAGDKLCDLGGKEAMGELSIVTRVIVNQLTIRSSHKAPFPNTALTILLLQCLRKNLFPIL